MAGKKVTDFRELTDRAILEGYGVVNAGLDFQDPGKTVGLGDFDSERSRQRLLTQQKLFDAGQRLQDQTEGFSLSQRQSNQLLNSSGFSQALKFFEFSGGDLADVESITGFSADTLGSEKKTDKIFTDLATEEFASRSGNKARRELQKTDRERIRRSRFGRKATILTSPTGVQEKNILGGALEL